MKKNFLTMLLIGQLALVTKIYSQNIAINGTGSLPDTSAMLDVSSTNKGFLAPRMTTAQQNAIPLPANGLLIYNTTTSAFTVNTGTPASPSWTAISFAGGAATGNGWSLSGNSGTNSSSNYIGTSDGQPIVFKSGGTQAGYLGLSGSSYATSFGVGSSASFKSTALGSGAMANTQNEATAVGYTAGALGYQSVAIGSNAQAMNLNETIAIGHNSSANSYQGIAIGAGASTSSNNISMAIGVGASATGYQSNAIGNNSSATAQNSTAIGNGASATNANYISLGNTSVTAIRGQVNFTTYSDGRFKRNIQPDVPGLDFILQLRPVTYNWDIHKFNAHSRGDESLNATQVKYTMPNDQDEAAILKKESITYTGFIAQEVEKAAQSCKFDFSGVLKPLNNQDAYSLSYAEFVVPLVKATQELNKKNEALNNKIDNQQKMIEQLMEEVKQLKKKQK